MMVLLYAFLGLLTVAIGLMVREVLRTVEDVDNPYS